MSDFAPGFAARQHGAEQHLARTFGDPGGFAPDLVRFARRGGFEEPVPASPRHFSPADRGTNPTEGWDPFAAEVQPETNDFVDPVAAAHAAGVIEGRAALRAEIEAARAEETGLADQLTQALAAGSYFDREKIAEHLRQTVLHLVTRMIGEAGISGDILGQRIDAAVKLLADSGELALLRLHPDDLPLVEGKLPGTLFAIADLKLTRGSFVIESASTIVEDGPDLWLEQLAQAIDRVPLPPLC
ncbi:FliH/SctL family protein [Sphingomonas sp. MMS12-HWE2-04]|uniref:FliH/SctL family protein n=1 Tax=Sphingomonas sp. MMS12-HWE2-04 TaxID=3234199 RepID=UPI00384DB6F6